jgi:hypothetical protein
MTELPKRTIIASPDGRILFDEQGDHRDMAIVYVERHGGVVEYSEGKASQE